MMMRTMTDLADQGVLMRHRMATLPTAGPEEELRIETGKIADYRRLAVFHYKSARCGAVTTVYRLVHNAPTVVGRYLRRQDETAVIGVLVRSLPHMACSLRDVATSGRYRGIGRNGAAVMLNRELRTISRVVVDPVWRGLGLAVRLVRHALGDPETVFTEALAVMGRVNPFFERAGMTRYDRPPRPQFARLLDALDALQLSATDLASPGRVKNHLAQCNEDEAAWLENELRRWHRAACTRPHSQTRQVSSDELLGEARDRLMAQPVYYIFDHRTVVEG